MNFTLPSAAWSLAASSERAAVSRDLARPGVRDRETRDSNGRAPSFNAALGKVKFMDPATDCISPIGESLLVESLQREYPNAFLVAKTRPPAVYRGNPFQVEVALAHDPPRSPPTSPSHCCASRTASRCSTSRARAR